MKKFRKSLICACTVIMGLSGTQLMAQESVVNKVIMVQESVPTVSDIPTTLEISPREEFIKELNQKINLNVIHNKEMEYKDWIKTDLAYLGDSITNNKLTAKQVNAEIDRLHQELIAYKQGHTMELNGAIIEPYYVTANKDAIMNAIEVRENILRKMEKSENLLNAVYYDREVILGRDVFDVYDKTIGNNPLSSDSTVSSSLLVLGAIFNMEDYYYLSDAHTEEINLIAGALFDILADANTPKNLIKNLKFYISPYRFFAYKGFTTSSNLIGRDEAIFISIGEETATYNNIQDTILHELGHVYQSDMIGASSGANSLASDYIQDFKKWSEIRELLDCEDLRGWGNFEAKQKYVAESMAEHFRMVMIDRLHLDKEKAGESVYPIVKKVTNLIEKDIEKYGEVKVYEAIPDVYINNEELESHAYNSKYYETYKSDSNGITNILFNTQNQNPNVEFKYDLLVRVGDGAEYIVKNKDISNGMSEELKLKKGEYALTIHSDNALYRYMDFFIK